MAWIAGSKEGADMGIMVGWVEVSDDGRIDGFPVS